MKVDELYKKVEDTFVKHQAACRKLTDYIIEEVVEDMEDYEFNSFYVFYSYTDGVALSIEIEDDKKQKIDPISLNYGCCISVCDVKAIISMYKKEKRKITIKEIFDNRF